MPLRVAVLLIGLSNSATRFCNAKELHSKVQTEDTFKESDCKNVQF